MMKCRVYLNTNFKRSCLIYKLTLNRVDMENIKLVLRCVLQTFLLFHSSYLSIDNDCTVRNL